MYKYPVDRILKIFAYLRNQYFMKWEKLTRTDLVVPAHRINGKNYIYVRLPFENVELKSKCSTRTPQEHSWGRAKRQINIQRMCHTDKSVSVGDKQVLCL